MDRNIVVIAHDIRSAHNIGALLRTCDGLGVEKLHLTGYTPYPKYEQDVRLPHLAEKIHKQIQKTSLGAESTVDWRYSEDILKVFEELKKSGYTIVALEQAKNSVHLTDFKPPDKIALLLGREVEGIDPELLKKCDKIIEIPMLGQKESLNVSVAAAITLYHIMYCC